MRRSTSSHFPVAVPFSSAVMRFSSSWLPLVTVMAQGVGLPARRCRKRSAEAREAGAAWPSRRVLEASQTRRRNFGVGAAGAGQCGDVFPAGEAFAGHHA
jgi:hypothetical protein